MSAVVGSDKTTLYRNPVLIGTLGSDAFAAIPSNRPISALAPDETVFFNFHLFEAVLSCSRDHVIIGTRESQTILTAFSDANAFSQVHNNGDDRAPVDDLRGRRRLGPRQWPSNLGLIAFRIAANRAAIAAFH